MTHLPGKRVIFLFVLLFALFGPDLPAQPAQASGVSDHLAITMQNAVTIKTVFIAPTDVDSAGKYLLVGLAAQPGGPPNVLEVEWSAVQTGWFPAWYVTMHSSTGLLTGELQVGRGGPAAGHQYASVLSFDPQAGLLSYSLTDIASGQRAAAGTWRTGQYAGQLYGVAAAGAEVTTHAWYEPVGDVWDIGVRQGNTFMAVNQLEPGDTVWIRLRTAGSVAGEYRVVSGDGTVIDRLAGSAVVAGDNWLSVPAGTLPTGVSSIALQYVENGEVRYSETRTVTAGIISALLQNVHLDQGRRVLEGELRLQTGSPLRGVGLQLQASVSALTWDPAKAGYTAQASSTNSMNLSSISGLPAGVTTVPVTIPVPDQAGLWQADFRLSANPQIPIQMAGAQVKWSTYTWTTVGSDAAGITSLTRKAADNIIRIGTYNMLGFQGWPEEQAALALGNADDPRRLDHFTQVIRSLSCDILGIQEGASVEQMRQLAKKLSLNLAAFPSATNYPGGVFTEYPVLETRIFNQAGPSGVDAAFSRFGAATLLEIKGNLLWVVDLHAHVNSQDLRNQEAAILDRQLVSLAQVTPNIVVLGDFNSPIGTIIHETLHKHGLHNALQMLNNLQPTITDKAAVGTATIDHIYLSESLVGMLHAGWVVGDIGFRLQEPWRPGMWVNSDHLPVVIELQWQ